MKKIVLSKTFSGQELSSLEKEVNDFKKKSGLNCIATQPFHLATKDSILFTFTVYYEEFE